MQINKKRKKATALKYTPEKDAAPRVIAKGTDLLQIKSSSWPVMKASLLPKTLTLWKRCYSLIFMKRFHRYSMNRLLKSWHSSIGLTENGLKTKQVNPACVCISTHLILTSIFSLSMSLKNAIKKVERIIRHPITMIPALKEYISPI